VRLTGGEPLIKKDISKLISMLKNIEGIKEVSLTTNGVLLGGLIHELKQSGLDRVNISLDTLDKTKFKEISGFDSFDNVWRSVELALKLKFNPVKLNVVPMAKINSDELIDFAKLTLKYPLAVRFIEFFHTNERSKKLFASFVSSESIKKAIEYKFGNLKSVSGIKSNGPSIYYKIKDAKGIIGFISPTTGDFCSGCRRIRLSCDGKISLCLFDGAVKDICKLIRSNVSDKEISETLKKLFRLKPKYTKNSIKHRCIEMSSLGG
jgi:cyclic pyranopterin phosphate synthase